MLVFFVISIFILLAIYLLYLVYKKKDKVSKKYNENNEYDELEPKKEKGIVYIFYAKWCNHSNALLKKIPEYENMYKEQLKFIKIDGDKKGDMADKYNIESFPTLVLVYKNENYIYDADLDKDTFELFITSIMK